MTTKEVYFTRLVRFVVFNISCIVSHDWLHVCLVSWQKGMWNLVTTFYKVTYPRYFLFSVFHCKDLCRPWWFILWSAHAPTIFLPCMCCVALPACLSLSSLPPHPRIISSHPVTATNTPPPPFQFDLLVLRAISNFPYFVLVLLTFPMK